MNQTLSRDKIFHTGHETQYVNYTSLDMFGKIFPALRKALCKKIK